MFYIKSLNDLFRVRIAQALHDLKIRLSICLQQCGLTGMFRRCFSLLHFDQVALCYRYGHRQVPLHYR